MKWDDKLLNKNLKKEGCRLLKDKKLVYNFVNCATYTKHICIDKLITIDCSLAHNHANNTGGKGKWFS